MLRNFTKKRSFLIALVPLTANILELFALWMLDQNITIIKNHSIILLAVVDADYCVTFIDIGAPGRESDSSIFKCSNFGQKLTRSQLDLPEPIHLPNNIGNPRVPYVFVGDAAFGLNKNVMTPFTLRNRDTPKKIFNYRLSRARRFVDAFGTLSNKWRIFHSSIIINPQSAKHIIKAVCVLHNFVRRRWLLI